jgi:polar amino acid transport system substrate-binding protein
MRQKLLQGAAYMLILIILISLFAGCNDRRKTAATEDIQKNDTISKTHQTSDSKGEAVTDEGEAEYTALRQLSGKTVSCQTGSIADLLVDSVIPDVNYSYFNSLTDMLTALQNNKVEGVPVDEPVARLSVSQNPDLTMLPERIVEDHYGIALQKNSELTAQVNAAIAALREAGTLEEMKEKCR